jgi:heme/copper-type cytochrome/quinol oxidase subunit 2
MGACELSIGKLAVVVAIVVIVALLAAAAAVHYRRKAVQVADATPQQEGEEREESVARDSTAETATLTGKAMNSL